MSGERVLRFALSLGLALGLVKLAVFRCVAGTSSHEASLSLALADYINIRRCTCTGCFQLHSSTILVGGSNSDVFCRTTRYFPPADPDDSLTTFRIDSGACDARTAIFMPSENVSRPSPSYSWIRRSHSVNWPKKVRCVSRIPTKLHDSHEHCCVSSSCVRLILRLDSFPSRDAVMFLSASDQSQRFSTNCVHKEIVQLFRTKISSQE